MSTPTQEEEAEGSESEDDDDGDLSSDIDSEEDIVIVDEIDNLRSPLNIDNLRSPLNFYSCHHPHCVYTSEASNVEENQAHEAQHDRDAQRDLNLDEFKKPISPQLFTCF